MRRDPPSPEARFNALVHLRWRREHLQVRAQRFDGSDEPRLQLARSTHAVMKLVVAVLALFATANAFTVPAAPRTIAAPRTSSPVAVVSDEKTDEAYIRVPGKYLSSNPYVDFKELTPLCTPRDGHNA